MALYREYLSIVHSNYQVFAGILQSLKIKELRV